MAISTALQTGKNARIYVSSDGVTANKVIVRSMNSISHPQESSSDTTATFDDDPAPTSSTNAAATYSIGGLFRPGDPGQVKIRDARANGDTVWLHVYPDGASAAEGWRQEVSIGRSEWSAATSGFQPWSFDATAVGAKTAEGTNGYVI